MASSSDVMRTFLSLVVPLQFSLPSDCLSHFPLRGQGVGSSAGVSCVFCNHNTAMSNGQCTGKTENLSAIKMLNSVLNDVLHLFFQDARFHAVSNATRTTIPRTLPSYALNASCLTVKSESALAAGSLSELSRWAISRPTTKSTSMESDMGRQFGSGCFARPV